MSRVVVFDRFGGPEVLRVVDEEPAAPRSGEVRIQIEAAAVNPIDILSRSGTSPAHVALPHARLGVEATGVVEAVGPETSGFHVGDPVIVTAIPDFVARGSYADRLTVPSSVLILRPPQLTVPQAAASWVAFSTAYGALVGAAGTRPGDRVVVSGASGAVGRAAIQVARLVGAVPIALTRRRNGVAPLETAGAAAVVVTDAGNPADAIRAATDGEGADIVLDLVRGPGQADLIEATRRGGVVVAAGFLDPRPTPPSRRDDVTLVGYRGFETLADKEAVDRMAAFFVAGVEKQALLPRIDREFPLAEAVEAHRHYESGRNRGGKVVLRP
ncbi:zinc-dependent alcohol dehydrogenase family protein [Leifsonia sp. ZF2019]|uniref:zinc-dependent alcohol dehydrogenase family protein n=1 Tax=Leifsonia sp. ZF2019 TaxID=2781978 RepID=UPI001CC102B5|nr:zinc-dependent alcohol dehydrogenase family protein [Leifsonia sp. ZF2019]UAJ80686.1 zinc-dependent alcohol dehydrogenase family protein [Leifsonia sp. ZF2019]